MSTMPMWTDIEKPTSTSVTDNISLNGVTTDEKPHLNPLLAEPSAPTNNQQADTDIESKPNTSSSQSPISISSPSPPSSALPTLQKWNQPRGNIARLLAAFFSFFVFGLNDGAWGALIPYLERYYSISYTVVSLIFLCPFAGYTLAAFTLSWLHTHFGQRAIAVLAPICYLITYVTLSLHPPWPAVVVITVIGGFGSGLIDGAWSSWAGHMVAGNVLEGSLHAFYALGATMAPLIVTSMVVRRNLQWYVFYYMMSGLACVALVVGVASFWRKTAAVYRAEHPDETSDITSTSASGEGEADGKPQGNSNATMKTALKHRVTWLCSAFFLLYVGAEVALGGWIVSFMLHVRHASPYVSGITATGFWAGMTVGRSGLGILTHVLIEVTNRPASSSSVTTHATNINTNNVNEAHPPNNSNEARPPKTKKSYRAMISSLGLTERSIVSVYLLLAIVVQLLFWLVPSITASAICVALLGMFLGPIFPSGIIMATKLLPPHLHMSSVGFSTAIGGTGGAVFPFVVGAIAQAKGVQVLQPIVVAMLAVLVGLWWCFPQVSGRSGGVGDGEAMNE